MTRNNAEFQGKPTHMTANEIVAKYRPSDVGRKDYLPWETFQGDHIEENESEMWDRKYDESKQSGFWNDGSSIFPKKQPPLTKLIAKNGFDQSQPIELHEGKGLITHGHHRLAVMLKHSPNELLPVKFVDND